MARATTTEVAPGDAVHRGPQVTVDRYTRGARINHWITAASLVLLAISGLALFHPSLYWMTAFFGGGPNTRAIHPWIGVVLFFGFLGLFIRFWKLNLWEHTDNVWLKKIKDVVLSNEENLPEVGKYNAGQKMVFWSMSFLIIILITSGIVIWEHYFGGYFTIEQRRLAVLAHAVAAVAAICVWIVPRTQIAA